MPRAPSPVSHILKCFVSQFETKIAPLSLAESWDNVGILIECPSAEQLQSLRIIACIDLTNEVISEAIQKKCNMILSYHPILFRPVQSLSCVSHLPLLRCIEGGVNVFSPHTALDAAVGGMNDHLCDVFKGFEKSRVGVRTDNNTGASIGRVLQLTEMVSLDCIIKALKKALKVSQVRYASPHETMEVRVTSIAVCVGSGGSLLAGADADVYLTGEMSHHEILSATSKGRSVILLDHSSSERPFLPELVRRVSELDLVEFVCVSERDIEPIKVA